MALTGCSGAYLSLCREIVQYDDPKISLVHSDFEKLENKPAPVFNKGTVCLNNNLSHLDVYIRC